MLVSETVEVLAVQYRDCWSSEGSVRLEFRVCDPVSSQ